jgi:thiol-disulfide isomerase/thioredoxin
MSRTRIMGLTAFMLLALIVPRAQAAAVESITHIDLLKTINAARGRVVVINFFATWCAPCLQEIPGLKRIRASYPEDKLLLLGISMDDKKQDIVSFIAKEPLNFPVYFAEGGVAQVFQVSGVPKLLVYSQRGALALKRDGYISESELQGHLEEILANE